MNLPLQSVPVSREAGRARRRVSGIEPSGIACTLCCTAAKACPSLGTVCAPAGCIC
jgi:hypothetical protein